MRITEVKTFARSFKLDNAPRRGVGQPIKKDTVVVRVKTEDGIVGYGEAHHALAPTGVADLVNQNLAPIVVGSNAMEVEDTVKPDSPILSGKDLVERVKKNPTSVSFGIATSLGNPIHQSVAAPLRSRRSYRRRSRCG